MYAKDPSVEARSCGTHPLANTPASRELVSWADIIVCMEAVHREELLRQVPEAAGKRFVVLDIPDVYARDDPQLVVVLRRRMQERMEG